MGTMGTSICYTPWDAPITHFGSPEDSQVELAPRRIWESDRGGSYDPIIKAKARKLAGRRNR